MAGMISDATNEMVRSALDAASLRHLVFAHNIANAATPGFVPLKVSFSRQLDAALRETGDKAGGRPGRWDLIVEQDHNAIGLRGEGVNLDTEVAKLSQNVVHYQALLRALNGKMAILSLAASEGRR